MFDQVSEGTKGTGQRRRDPLCAWVLAVIVTRLAMTKRRAARRPNAVGSNPEAADLVGIDAARVALVALVQSGVMAGFMFLARFGNLTAVAGLGFKLKSVASTVMGAVCIFGGKGTLVGSLLAILTRLNLRNGMGLLDIMGHLQTGVIGILLIPRVHLDRRGEVA